MVNKGRIMDIKGKLIKKRGENDIKTGKING